MGFLILAHFLNGFLMIAMPIGLAIFLIHKFHLNGQLWWIGAGTFLLSQVGHIPFNFLINPVFNQFSFISMHPAWQLVIHAGFLGISAGLFEELLRYGMFKWWAKDARSWKKGLLTGAGHGGAEAIILGVLVMFTFIQLTVIRNTDLSALFPTEKSTQAQQLVNTYWSATWYDSLLGAVERLFSIPMQICFAVIVLQTFTRKQWFWVWLAVLLHAFIDMTVVLATNFINVYWAEAIVGLFSVMSIILTFVLRQPEIQTDSA